MSIDNFYQELSNIGIDKTIFLHYLSKVKILGSQIKLLATYDIKPFLEFNKRYENFISYLIIDDKFYILVTSNDKYYLLNIEDKKIENVKLSMKGDYENLHKDKILKGKRLNQVEAEKFIKTYINYEYIKSIEYIYDESHKYYKQNRLLLYAPWVEEKCKTCCNISKEAKFKYILPLSIKYDNKKNRFNIKVKTIFKKDIDCRIMI